MTLAGWQRVNSRLRTVWKGRLPFFRMNCRVNGGWKPGGSCQDHLLERTCLGVKAMQESRRGSRHTSLSLDPTAPEAGVWTCQFPS